MDRILSLLKISPIRKGTNINCGCDINIDYIEKTYVKINNAIKEDSKLKNIMNGYGIFFDSYVITLNHIIENIVFRKYTINKEEYEILFKIEIYDIAVLIKKDVDKNTQIFLEKINKFYEESDIYNFSEISEFNENKILSIGDTNINLKFDSISSVNITSKLYPSLPIVISKSDITMEMDGYSGSIVHDKNKIIGLLMSINGNNEYEILPLYIIKLLINSYIKNFLTFYCLPFNVEVKKSKIDIENITNILEINNSKTPLLSDKDSILRIDGNVIDEDEYIYSDFLNIMISLDTYILLSGKNMVNIEYIKYSTNSSKTEIISDDIRLHEIDFTNTEITLRDTSTIIELFGLEFKQLSEEYLLKCIKNNILIPELSYNHKFSDKQILILSGIKKNINYNILEILNKHGININENLYRISKISKKEVNTINDILYHLMLDKKQVTIEFLNIDNTRNTVKLFYK